MLMSMSCQPHCNLQNDAQHWSVKLRMMQSCCLSDALSLRTRSYTFNSDADSANRTFVNIKEREGFIIAPFTASIASQAVAFSHTRDEYTFGGAFEVLHQ